MVIRKRLNNGINLLIYSIPNLQSVCMSLCTAYGANIENFNNLGAVHLLEHLHFRKLGNLNQNELYKIIDLIGGNFNAITYKDMVRFYMTVHHKYLYDCAKIFKEIILTNDWTEEDIQSEKEIVLREMAEKAEFDNDIDVITDEMIFGNTSLKYPVIGKHSAISNVTKTELIDLKNKLFCSGGINIVVTGNVDSEAQTFLEKLFDDIVNEEVNNNEFDISEDSSIRMPEVKFICNSWKCLDVRLVFDVDTNIKDYEAEFFNSVFGGGTTSLLQRYIREKLGLSSNIYSYIRGSNNTLNLIIDYSVDNNFLNKSLEEIKNLISNLNTLINEEEISRSIVFFTDNLLMKLDNAEQLNEDICWYLINNHNEEYSIEKRIHRYKGITVFRLREIANSIFGTKKSFVIVKGNVKNISKNCVKRFLIELYSTQGDGDVV